MSDKKNKDKIGKISGTGSTKSVRGTESVSEVDRVKGASSITRVSGVSGVKNAQGVQSIKFEQREKLLSMISEEAEKLAAQGLIPKNQREVVERAVQMVIDAALLDNTADDDHKK